MDQENADAYLGTHWRLTVFYHDVAGGVYTCVNECLEMPELSVKDAYVIGEWKENAHAADGGTARVRKDMTRGTVLRDPSNRGMPGIVHKWPNDLLNCSSFASRRTI